MKDTGYFDFDADYGVKYETTIRAIFPAYDNLYAAMNALLQIHLGEEVHILIVGAGGGNELLVFGENNPKWKFTGIDLSEQMVRHAKSKIAGSDIEDRTALRVGCLEDLDNQPLFDAATCILVMHFVSNDGEKESLLRQISGRLKPGAPLLLVSINGDPSSEEFRLYYQALQKKLASSSSITDEEAGTVLNHALTEMCFCSKERMGELMTLAGFPKQVHFFSDLQFDGWLVIRN